MMSIARVILTNSAETSRGMGQLMSKSRKFTKKDSTVKVQEKEMMERKTRRTT
jgi:hypothetical protein